MRLALAVIFCLAAGIARSGDSCPAQDAPAPIVPQAGTRLPNPGAKPPSYVEEPLNQLVKRIPGLKGILPSPDQQLLPTILQKTGEKVDEFFDNLVDVVAEERIEQKRLGGNKAVLAGEKVQDSYLILRFRNAMGINTDEYRADAAGKRMDQVGLDKGFFVTSGFALTCVHFSKALQPDSTFRLLGNQTISGRETYVVAFAQRSGKPTITVTMKAPNGIFVHMLMQGIAWVDTLNFHILRIRTDLLSRQPEIGLDEQTTEVNFAKVRFADRAAPLWLPRDVDVYVRFAAFGDRHYEEAFLNVHRYTNYRRYRVSTKMVPPQ